jgi:transposase
LARVAVAVGAAVEAHLLEAPFAAVVDRLSCLRGVSVLTALGLWVEIGDGRSIGAFLGLVVSEKSSGSRRRQGAITKTGNRHARRLLVEAAWHQRRPLRPSQTLPERRVGQSPAVCAHADLAARRLHQRWRRLETERAKRSTVVAVVVAREFAGWCWGIAVME